ncbi:MAG: hypothetical protein KF709_12825 [Gemmatimonadaceae bacterium]|nr:hypothetical protein [Gemmatimonadaceae bacterium]
MAGRLAALAGFALVAIFVLGIALKPALPDGLPAGRDGRILLLFLVAIALLIAHAAVVLLFDRGRFEVVGFGRYAIAPLALLGGPAIGLVAAALPIAIAVGLAYADFQAVDTARVAAAGELWSIVAAATLVETLAFRGYFQGLLEQQVPRVVAVLVPALVATVYRFWAQDHTWIGLTAVLATGLLLGSVRLRTQSLPAAWLCQLAVTIPVVTLSSGELAELVFGVGAGSSVQLVLSGPELLTGGALGIAGGALTAAVALLLALAIWPRKSRAASQR